MKGRGIASGRASALRYLRIRAAELATAKTRSLSDPLAGWALKRIRLDGRPFGFEGHEYLRGIYDDASPHVVLSKAAQIGGTTWAILRSIHACMSGLNVMYFFPTRTDVLEFSKSRVSPLLAENPFLARQMTETDTAGLKRIGDAHLYLRGMQSSVGMKSVPADMIVFDELDEATARGGGVGERAPRALGLQADPRALESIASGLRHRRGLPSLRPTALDAEVPGLRRLDRPRQGVPEGASRSTLVCLRD